MICLRWNEIVEKIEYVPSSRLMSRFAAYSSVSLSSVQTGGGSSKSARSDGEEAYIESMMTAEDVWNGRLDTGEAGGIGK